MGEVGEVGENLINPFISLGETHRRKFVLVWSLAKSRGLGSVGSI